MSKQIPDFKKALAKLLPRLIGQESLMTCRKLRDSQEELSRTSLASYNVDLKYQTLLKESPLLISSLFGASCCKRFSQIQVSLFPLLSDFFVVLYTY